MSQARRTPQGSSREAHHLYSYDRGFDNVAGLERLEP